MKTIIRHLIIVLVTLFSFFGFSSTIFALTISPAKIDITGDPGTVVYSEIKILNEQSDTRTFFTSYENFEPSGDTGAPRFVGAEGGLATWLQADEKVVLAPGETKIIPFSISIPKDAQLGGYFAAIFWGSQSPEVRGTSEVAVGGKIGALVLLSVSGAVEEAAGLLDFSTKNNQKFFTTLPVAFNYRVNNTGGDRIVPNGTITIKDSFWLTTEKLVANKNEGSVLPGSARKFEAVWGNSNQEEGATFIDLVRRQAQDFHFGFYVAKLNLAWGSQGQSVDASYLFFIFPWQLLLVVIPILVALFFFGRKMLQAYKQKIIKQALGQK